MGYRGDLWSPVYDYCKLLFNGIMFMLGDGGIL